jgi:AcrR family transcriptional regulator
MSRPAPQGRREAILTAARSEFAARGYAAARLDDIAATVGISKAALYLQFTDKAALFRALIVWLVDGTMAQLAPPAGLENSTAATQLRHLLDGAIQRMTIGEAAFLPRLIIGEGGNFPDLVRFYHEQSIARMFGVIEGIIARGVAMGEFRAVNPALVARTVAGAVVLAAIWKTVFEPVGIESLDVVQMGKSHLDILLHGLTLVDLA